ncbi:uncharacterized protein LOC128602772 isoform X4 [Ictalurus furcatus]|uniref:uncharacterized protein LOC128602772 isoform X4 n=1 Tax=Ictalurus furcatus TaxID=66913 RepID=UPI002350B540|nr:uncharacterized protein LOC128602772 isoform X4 [Ictalurus furcatus]
MKRILIRSSRNFASATAEILVFLRSQLQTKIYTDGYILGLHDYGQNTAAFTSMFCYIPANVQQDMYSSESESERQSICNLEDSKASDEETGSIFPRLDSSFSGKLDPVAAEFPPCVRAVAAAEKAVLASRDLRETGKQHDCVVLTNELCYPRVDLKDVPLENPDLILLWTGLHHVTQRQLSDLQARATRTRKRPCCVCLAVPPGLSLSTKSTHGRDHASKGRPCHVAEISTECLPAYRDTNMFFCSRFICTSSKILKQSLFEPPQTASYRARVCECCLISTTVSWQPPCLHGVPRYLSPDRLLSTVESVCTGFVSSLASQSDKTKKM